MTVIFFREKEVIYSEKDGGWERQGPGQVHGEEVQAGQHVQPHDSILLSRNNSWYVYS